MIIEKEMTMNVETGDLMLAVYSLVGSNKRRPYILGRQLERMGSDRE